ncbi:hypothetical protein QYS49_31895 [Marivirga salinae]|uniref:Lipoprotein n=1 Tax=Marivirga salinarum TaxID=3059078 RepID=A0AA51RB92_9BACT|nr:hypothetical protein [Marivirga sp. BDSF4-3]WMN11956.1 hypothetical protein QYS49_31895 [Marivirga sp. BDSF4-3]
MKLFFTILGTLLIFQACETAPPAQGPNAQNANNQTDDDQGIIVIKISTNLNTELTDWVFSPSKSIKIPDLPIDSIIFQAPVRSVKEVPGAEAVLFNVSTNSFISSSILKSNVRYTIKNYRSGNLKGYFNSRDYVLRVGLRSQEEGNAVSIPYECKLIIYHQL